MSTKGKARRGRYDWCHYCGMASRRLTWDHVVPRSLGGPDKRWNFVPACETCNRDKGSADMRDHCSMCAEVWARFLTETTTPQLANGDSHAHQPVDH